MDDRQAPRWGSWAAIGGGVLAVAFNLMHPKPESYTDQVGEEMRMVGASDAWVTIHVGILAAFLLITFGLYAVVRSMKGGPAEGRARVALGSLLITTPVMLATLLVDGPGFKALADAVAQDPAMLPAATAGVYLGWALFTGSLILALGITPLTFGWALSADRGYPGWLGWAGVLFGLAGIATGLTGIYGGSTETFWLVFSISSGLLTLWTIALGFFLGRRAPDAVTIPEGAGARAERPTRV